MPTDLLTATAAGTLATLSAGGRHRVSCLRLDGGGSFVYWMTEGETYRLCHDGTDWSVTGAEWFNPGQVYRLSKAVTTAQALPLSPHGHLVLRPGVTYEIRAGHTGRWTVYALGN
ncbi:hypothetical protein [Longispora albida]|uniref:hypothetical protein n=1 Tax=Longispora albida TaxID=203523 RepID=UPI000366A549|nr:hypothetical protein [Longispora albida]